MVNPGTALGEVTSGKQACYMITNVGLVSNGALFMLNTYFIQGITRCSLDNYSEAMDCGQPVANPHYLRIAKGSVSVSSIKTFIS